MNRIPCASRGVRSAQSATYATKTKRTLLAGVLFVLEVQAGFEPADNGVADRGLTTWLLHQNFLLPQHYNKVFLLCQGGNKKILQLAVIFEKLRREYRIRTSHYTVKIKETFYSPRNSSLEE